MTDKAMTRAQEYRKLIIAEYLKPALKQRGFRKKNNLFYSERENCIHLVSVQSSSWTLPESCNITINIGIYFPRVAEELNIGLRTIRQITRAEEGQLNERIGLLLPEPYDKWWMILPDSDWKTIAEDITSSVEKYGLSWLEKMSSFEAAKKQMESNSRFLFASAFALCIGDRGEAKRLFSLAIKREGTSPYLQRLIDWGRSKGLM